MCGIAGGLDLAPDVLAQMLARLDHRGPDDRGSFSGSSFAIGMTRLAILDQANGRQPFASSDGRVQAICNGEIYNWQELRKDLEKKGHHFITRCDCEILPAAWLEWGHDLPAKLNGMFALAILDQEKNSLFLARDRCGQKPLYFTTSGPFRFASEIKALSPAGVSLNPDPRQLSRWLSLRYLPGAETLFENIESLPSGHSMTVNAHGNRRLQAYWNPGPPPKQKQLSEHDTLDELDRLAKSSVELALQSDVPIAAYLSAGVDSSLLVHYLKELDADITTVSIGFGAHSDETPHAQHFAQSLSLPHKSTTLTPDSLAELPRVIQQMDQPIGDALILAFDHLASHTTSLGCKVALGGEGPDELFAGYSFQKALLTATKLPAIARTMAGKVLEFTPGPILDQLSGFPASLGKGGRKKVARYLQNFSSLSLQERRTGLHSLFESSEINRLIAPDLLGNQSEGPPENYAAHLSLLENILTTQYQSWLPNWSLIRQDKNSMAHSLEYRAPFLDHRLIDFSFTVPDDMKIKGRADKYLWRQLAARSLPHEVTHRPKQPFYLPLEHPSWREPLIQMAREFLAPSTIAEQGWFRFEEIEPLFQATSFLPLKKLTALLILQIWSNEHY